MSQKPTVGRIVHFIPRDSFMESTAEHRAAIVVAVIQDTTVNLCTWLVDGQTLPARNVPYDETGKKQFSWHWPEREEYQEYQKVDFEKTIPTKE